MEDNCADLHPDERKFFLNTSKREMFLIIEQLAGLCRQEEHADWLERAVEERELLKINGIV